MMLLARRKRAAVLTRVQKTTKYARWALMVVILVAMGAHGLRSQLKVSSPMENTTVVSGVQFVMDYEQAHPASAAASSNNDGKYFAMMLKRATSAASAPDTDKLKSGE